MKTALVLDFNKWRAGGGSNISKSENKIGEGRTSLLNSFGFMCCLGQFGLQCGFEEKDIKYCDEPGELNKLMEGFNKQNYDDEDLYNNTPLSDELININDNQLTTYQTKIRLMTDLLNDHGYELIVINTPENI